MVFSAQIMKKKLDNNLPEHDRRSTLAMLGVDVTALSAPVYNQDLIGDRLRMFCNYNNILRARRDRVWEDVNFTIETTEQAG